MNDRPLNSYYYMPHCSNYVVHWVSLCTPTPIKRKEKKDTSASSFLFAPFFQTCWLIRNFVMCMCVSMGRGALCLNSGEVTAGFSSPVHTHTPEAQVFVPWGPGVLRSQRSKTWNQGRQLLSTPSRTRVGERVSKVSSCCLPIPLTELGPGLSGRRCSVGCWEGSGWVAGGRGPEPCALVGGGWCPSHPSFGSRWPSG